MNLPGDLEADLDAAEVLLAKARADASVLEVSCGGLASAYQPNVAAGAAGPFTFQSNLETQATSLGYGFTVSLAKGA